MRLTVLSPRWVANANDGVRQAAKTGISFVCPHCKKQRLVVFFKPYIDPDNEAAWRAWKLPDAPDMNTGEPSKIKFWNRTAGESFETMCLSPSIDFSGFEGHWHGFITNGEVS